MKVGDRLIALKDKEPGFIKKGRKYKITKIKDGIADLRSLNGLIYTHISEEDYGEYFEKLPPKCKFRRNDIVINEETKDILLIAYRVKVGFEDMFSVLKLNITTKTYLHYKTEFVDKNYKKLTYENYEECKRK